MSAILNRLEKNHKKLSSWAKRIPLDAWRLYDRDIPEYPFIVDVYGELLLVHDKSDARIDAGKNHLPELLEALKKIFQVSDDKIVFKNRARQEGLNQYEKLGEKGEFFTVREASLKFRVNLHDYLDTGLFLDHRPMRHRIQKTSKDRRVLNLFCYTGSVSVAAASGGAQVTSVDMSATYLAWARENFLLNALPPEEHEFIQNDVLQWLALPATPEYDLIFLDPPTFSNSKRMEDSFEVERDQEFLVDACMKRLKPGGLLYFSNNKRSFRLSEDLRNRYLTEDISEETIPQDFHDRKIHRCFRIHAR